MTTSVLSVENLSVEYYTGRQRLPVLREISLSVAAGETLGIVGESGSGKSTLGLAILRALPANGRISVGRVLLDGIDLAQTQGATLRTLWKRALRLVPQNPLAALNPTLRIGEQLIEAMSGKHPVAEAQAAALLARVQIADPVRVMRSYPHELSGGMQQRVMIAMALHGAPRLLVLDEPTTSLDVTTEAAVIDLLADLIAERQPASLFISHNLGLVARIATRTAVLYAGELVEIAPTATLFQQPRHPYTQGLLRSLPHPGLRYDYHPLQSIEGAIPVPGALPDGCVFAPRCPLANDRCRHERPPLLAIAPDHATRCHYWSHLTFDLALPAPVTATALPDRAPLLTTHRLTKTIAQRRSLVDAARGKAAPAVQALAAVDLTVHRNRTLGVVGESGSGKTTLARCIIGLTPPSGGTIELLGIPLAPHIQQRPREQVRRLQMVLQNPQEALNPALPIGEALIRPMIRLGGLDGKTAAKQVSDLLRLVNLPPDYANRRPHQLSGGEKQRVAIARALAATPDLLVLDEAVSALDVSVQAAVLNILADIKERTGITYLFITHDLAVVSYLADDVVVMYRGEIVEEGPVASVLNPPLHPYTEALLAATNPHGVRLREAEAIAPATGCPFQPRCPRALDDICRTEKPPWREAGNGHRLRCHIPLEELRAMQMSG
ncbi:ABC transporter ATP-binding protein [uncultured Chloroflexus sp.]|uniref:ABC transporter ATP-binding protein n=1 Tax=uncultured Chloroflexus sp. TaxID=214040 RepID=UPI002628F41B|nr:dipeptide ABC transporter ATP-binding protein [uncultured Chloroflexus sp.]